MEKDIRKIQIIQDRIRKKTKKCYKRGAIISLTIFVITFVILLKYIDIFDNYQAYIGILFMESVICFAFVIATKNTVIGKDKQLLEKKYKNTFVLGELKNVFDDVEYYPNEGFSEKYIKSIGMINTYDRYYSNDLVSAKYKNIKFEQSDIRIEEKETDRDGEISYDIKFLGKLMIFDFNKKFIANIQVASNGFEAKKLPYRKKFESIEIEDEEFNKMFSVYSDNQHDAFYIITPHFAEKLKKISLELNCEVMFCFIDSRLYIFVNNYENAFEFNTLEEIDKERILDRITKDIDHIISFVDELDLENDIFINEK